MRDQANRSSVGGAGADPRSDIVVRPLSGLVESAVPIEAVKKLVAGIDIDQRVLFHAVLAVEQDITGTLISYGA